MKVLDPGHLYELDNLKAPGTSILRFHKDSTIHGAVYAGPSTQEVLRAVIDRVGHLDDERPWPDNVKITQRGREMIALFEMRALWFKVAKGELDIASLPTGPDGHIIIGGV